MDDRWTLRLCVYRFLGWVTGLTLGAGLALGLALVAEAQSSGPPIAGPVPVPAAVAPADDLLADATAKHLWIVRPTPGGSALLHRCDAYQPGEIYKVADFDTAMLAIAAYDERLYLVKPDGKMTGVRFETRHEPGRSNYQWTVHPPLPLKSTDRLLGLAAGRHCLFAILRTAAGKDQPASLKLYRLAGGQWTDVAMPPGPTARTFVDIGMIDPDRNDLAIAWRTDPAAPLQFDRLDGTEWRRSSYDLAPADQIELVGIMRHPAVALRKADRWSVFLLLDDKVVPLASCPADQTAGATVRAVARARQIDLIVADAAGGLTVWSIDPNAPADATPTATPLTVRQQPPVEMEFGTIMMIAVVGLATIILLSNWKRDPTANLVHLPKTMRVCELSRRAMASLIDLAPAVLISWLYCGLDNPLNVLGQWPGYGGPWDQVRASVVAMALFFVHTTVTELFTARTLGKALTGCRVVGLSGGAPDLWQVLGRNILKLLELVVPMLLVLMVLSPYRQRLGDIIGRTVVIRKALSPPPGDNDDPAT